MYEAKKKFGQNFLKDKSVLKKIIESIPENATNIVEIGAGLGDLTYELLKKFKLRSYEIDKDLIEILKSKFAANIENGSWELIFGDALEIWRAKSLSESPYFLVANLPYYVATNMILRALDDEKCEGFVVMVQKEVALKFCAKSGESEFGAISVLAGISGECQLLFDVASESFNPPPKVTSSVFKLIKTRKIFDDFSKNFHKNLDENFCENSAKFQNFKENGENFNENFKNLETKLPRNFDNAKFLAMRENSENFESKNAENFENFQGENYENQADKIQQNFAKNGVFTSFNEYENFKSFLKICFNAPRKTLLKNLSAKYEKNALNEIFSNLNLRANLRAHELNFTLFFKIFKNLRIKDARNQ